MKTFKKANGFTLVELLVIIGLLGVILTGMIVLIDPAAQLAKGRDSQRKSDLKTIQTALELYRADNSEYPKFLTSSGLETWGWAVADALYFDKFGINYLRTIPTGPGLNGSESCSSPLNDPYHGYVYAGNASVYTIFTNLENTEDQEVKAGKPEPPYKPDGSASWSEGDTTFSWTGGSCPGTYNYWVISP